MKTNQANKIIGNTLPVLLKVSGTKTLELLQLADKNFKAYLALIGVIITAIGGLATLAIPLIEANIQAEATVKAARIGVDASSSKEVKDEPVSQSNNDSTSLKSYTSEINALLNTQNNSASNPIADKDIELLLKSNSFVALRSLASQDKGTFVRFLFESKLIGLDQAKISLAGANLRNVDLTDAWLPDINLQDTYIFDGTLVNTNLTRASLSGAVLEGADLTGAILTNADLKEVNLKGANLEGTNFREADLTNADLDIDRAVQAGADFCNAIMPDGIRHNCS